MIERDGKNESQSGEEGQRAPTAATPFAKRYYRVDEVAHYFSVSDRTIYRLIDTGDIKAIRLRDCIWIAMEELKRFENSSLIDL